MRALLLVALLATLAFVALGAVSMWHDDLPPQGTSGICIRYQDFVKYYRINPGRYYLCKGYVIADVPYGSKQALRFSFFDYWKYQHFYKSEKQGEKRLEDAKILESYLNVVMQDIEVAKEKSRQETSRAIKMLEQIHI